MVSRHFTVSINKIYQRIWQAFALHFLVEGCLVGRILKIKKMSSLFSLFHPNLQFSALLLPFHQNDSPQKVEIQGKRDSERHKHTKRTFFLFFSPFRSRLWQTQAHLISTDFDHFVSSPSIPWKEFWNWMNSLSITYLILLKACSLFEIVHPQITQAWSSNSPNQYTNPKKIVLGKLEIVLRRKIALIRIVCTFYYAHRERRMQQTLGLI